MAEELDKSITTPVDIESEMKKSYLDYAMSVIVGRALPDVRDGLKPVHRRILFGMYELGLTSTKAYRKCAKIVGEVLGKFHPHGDAPVYDALVRLAQDFNMRYPLVDGQGNFGSVDGDPPAAMRYTEARLSKIAEEMLADIEKETVDFVPNFDESEKEPVVLPTRIPNLLVNGSSGIAVGMATNIPPHNLKEVVEAAILLIEEPEANLKKIMKLVPGPDFPTAGYIYGREGIEQAYKTGRGSFQVRAKAAIEQRGKDRQDIVVTELPYQVNKARLIEHIAELIQNKKIEGIADIRDESDRDGMRIVIEVKRDEEPQIILNAPLQAHPDAGILQHDPAGHRRRAAARAGPAGPAAPFHRAPRGRGAPPHPVRTAQSPKSASTFCSATSIALDYIDDVIRDHPRIVQPRQRPREFARILRATRPSACW